METFPVIELPGSSCKVLPPPKTKIAPRGVLNVPELMMVFPPLRLTIPLSPWTVPKLVNTMPPVPIANWPAAVVEIVPALLRIVPPEVTSAAEPSDVTVLPAAMLIVLPLLTLMPAKAVAEAPVVETPWTIAGDPVAPTLIVRPPWSPVP
jgi:hypothetical protein